MPAKTVRVPSPEIERELQQLVGALDVFRLYDLARRAGRAC